MLPYIHLLTKLKPNIYLKTKPTRKPYINLNINVQETNTVKHKPITKC